MAGFLASVLYGAELFGYPPAKLRQLRAADAKCPDKRERVEADRWAWHRDGLNTTDWSAVRSALIYAHGHVTVVRLWASPTH